MSEAIYKALAKQGLFAGFQGLEGLRDANEFWDRQMYGTRLYYGNGGMDYLHRSALSSAISAIEKLQPENERLMVEIEAARADVERLTGDCTALQVRERELEKDLEQCMSQCAVLTGERDALREIINTPQSDDFIRAVSIEAEHQRKRWGVSHDGGKEPADWFWLIGYLAGKALHAHIHGNQDKAEHHIITTAAACANWHRAVFGKTDMRPGTDQREATHD